MFKIWRKNFNRWQTAHNDKWCDEMIKDLDKFYKIQIMLSFQSTIEFKEACCSAPGLV